ncbi:MAG: hypothetical protein HKN33_15055 [Pyrinomonadaceae bacterium]|nr:hypothetical protein [Pyrinomonadaceae bacterium]
MKQNRRRGLFAGFGAGARRLQPIMFLMLFVLAFQAGFAQEELPEGVVPPPLSEVSEEESDSLEMQRSTKGRTKLALEFMESRLLQSATAADKQDFDESLAQLGPFRALMLKTEKHLDYNSYKKSTAKEYKRFEKALRIYIRKLELIRRELPFSHGYHVSELIKTTREVREKSIDTFFGDTVIPDGRL